MNLQRFEQEDFEATLRRKDRDLLDQQLATLQTRQRWAENSRRGNEAEESNETTAMKEIEPDRTKSLLSLPLS